RSSSTRRASEIASPKRRKRPPLQVPIALRPGALNAAPGLGAGVAAGRVRALARTVLALVALLGADPDLLGLGLLWLRRRFLRRDDFQAQRFVFLVAGGVAGDHHGRARGHLALAQDFVGQRVLD